jgi:hypothetical protein
MVSTPRFYAGLCSLQSSARRWKSLLTSYLSGEIELFGASAARRIAAIDTLDERPAQIGSYRLGLRWERCLSVPLL